MRWRSSSSPPPVLLLLLLLLPLLTVMAVKPKAPTEFKICSYNVQKFNKEKVLNYGLLHTLTRIVNRCDICLLQEVVDPDGSVVQKLLSSINRYDGYIYNALSSKPLGKSAADMQQYVFLYRIKTVNVTASHQYQSNPRVFTREPFSVLFESQKTKMKKFVLVALHADPAQAVKEIDQLYVVFLELMKKWNNPNVMFLGDFHAACAYMTRNDKKKIRLFSNTSFSWMIGDKVDTTVNEETNCAYDRIVVHGETFLKAITPFSAKAYDFGKELKLSRSKVNGLSENLPVEVRLRSPASLLQTTPLLFLLSISALFLSP